MQTRSQLSWGVRPRDQRTEGVSIQAAFRHLTVVTRKAGSLAGQHRLRATPCNERHGIAPAHLWRTCTLLSPGPCTGARAPDDTNRDQVIGLAAAGCARPCARGSCRRRMAVRYLGLTYAA